MELQQALIDLGFLKGSADGIFGNKTENAVRSFQRANKLTVDGLAGKKTQSILFAARSTTSSASSSSAQAQASQASASQAASSQSSSSASSASDDTLFSGNYNSLRIGSAGNRVKILQSALITGPSWPYAFNQQPVQPGTDLHGAVHQVALPQLIRE